MNEHFDLGTLLVIAVTFVLFVAALFTTGLTHGLLLEAGVFLVSVKLIMMAHKNSVASKNVSNEIAEIKAMFKQRED
jgi:hypothetical protein